MPYVSLCCSPFIKICQNVTSLQEKGQKDKERIKSIQLEITGLKTEVSSLKDKKAIICQDKQLFKK